VCIALVPGYLGFVLADHFSWSFVYLVVASFMGVGILTTFLISEPKITGSPPKSLKEAVIEPFIEFFNRKGRGAAIEMLVFMLLYKFGDSLATALSTPFYIDVGFTLTQIGETAKVVGLTSSIIGGIVGGLIMFKIGINRSLWLFGFVQIVSILGFAVLSEAGPVIWVLALVVAFEYLGVGLGTAAFVAYIARACDKRFTATQFALFSSFVAVPRTFAAAGTGFLVESMGWTQFFILCTVLAIPGMLMLYRVAPWNERGR